MGFIDWLANINPSTRVLWGFGLGVLGLVLFVLRLSFTLGWSAQQPGPERPRSHARRWYGIRQGQESAGLILRRLAAERERLFAEPAGVPLAISSMPAWMENTATWPQPRIG